MSIRPIDAQLNIQNSIEVNRLSHLESQKGELFKQSFQKKMENDIKDNLNTIKETNKTDKQYVDKDGQNKNNKNNKKDNKKDSNKKKTSTSMFDISI